MKGYSILTDSIEPFDLVRTLRTGKALYEEAVAISLEVSEGRIRVEHNPFCPPGHIAGLDVNGKVVLLMRKNHG